MTSLYEYAQKNITNHVNGKRDSAFVKMTKLYFDKKDYLKDNKGIPRENMPQIDFDAFCAILPDMHKYTSITIGAIPASAVKATQNDVNVSKVMHKIASGKTVSKDHQFILGKDNYLLDGHHSHMQVLIQDKNRMINVICFDDIDVEELVHMFTTVLKDSTFASRDIQDNVIKECFESYGAQGPAAVPGMGAVVLPATSTAMGSAMNPENRGSGDVPSTIKKKKKDEDVEFATNKPS